jgi:Carboxypeptidase regulatory-like domain
MAWVTRVVCFAGAALLVTTQALAQGRISGTVKDPDDRPIKGATVTAENPNAAPSSFVATTDVKGRFAMLGLRSGLWTVTVEAPGFEASHVSATTRSAGLNAPLAVILTPHREIAPPGPFATVDVAIVQRKRDEAAELDAAGQIDTAIDRYREILTKLPALTSIHLQLGSLYERKHDQTAAIGEYQAMLKTDPGNTKARAALDRLTRQ